MDQIVEKAESPERQEVSGKVPAAEVRKALSAILRSPPFHASRQSQELLQYIVDQTLAGHQEMLKERIIGAQVFGRRTDYATNDDPIVRARAGEVRKRLALYYQIARHERLRISIPSGSFRAIFEWTEHEAGPVQLDSDSERISSRHAAEPEPLPNLRPGDRPKPLPNRLIISKRRWWIAIATSIVLLAGAIPRFLVSSEERDFNRFWSPILDSPHTTLIYVGGNAVYQLSASYLDKYYQQHPRSKTEAMGFESYIPLPADAKIDARDLYAAKDTFVTIGDVAAITRIESLLVRRNRQFNIRYGGDVAYGDLRESPSVLIGAHNNSWTLTMTGSLRYAFDGRNGIVDQMNPSKRWSTTAAFTEDYAIVSRVLNSKTGTTVITAAGVGFAGTQAAGEFITNPQSIAILVKGLPHGWEKKNIQIVLHTTVTNQLPSTPDVIAFYCW